MVQITSVPLLVHSELCFHLIAGNCFFGGNTYLHKYSYKYTVMVYLQEWKCSHYTNRQVEIKILLILCSYFIIWSSVIISSMVPIIEADEHQNTLEEYFTCEASGTQECEQQSIESLYI